jgi:hypothetical protein
LAAISPRPYPNFSLNERVPLVPLIDFYSLSLVRLKSKVMKRPPELPRCCSPSHPFQSQRGWGNER